MKGEGGETKEEGSDTGERRQNVGHIYIPEFIDRNDDKTEQDGEEEEPDAQVLQLAL